MSDIDANAKIKTAQINQALGFFIFVFGTIVSIAMVFTETFIQQMTDLVAGLVLISIGGGMMWKARKALKKQKQEEAK